MSTVSDATTLKHLDRRIAEARAAQQALAEERKDLNDKERDARLLLDELLAKRAALVKESQGIVVSEHALLRYLERVRGVDMEEVRKLVLPAETEAVVKQLGNCTVPVGKSHKVRVREGVVVTVED